MLKSISDLKTLFEVMALVIVKLTSTFPAFYVIFFIVSELAFIQNKQQEEASYTEQKQNKK